MPLPFHAAYAPSTCTASCLSAVTLSSRHTCQTTASSTAKDIGRCAAMVHLTLHKVLLFPSGSVTDRPVCRATPGSNAHEHCGVSPKTQRVSESEPAAHFRAKRYRTCQPMSCSLKLVHFSRYCEPKSYADFKAKHPERQSKCFPPTLQMLWDTRYGHSARALHTCNNAAHQHGSSAQRGEPARAAQGSAIV